MKSRLKTKPCKRCEIGRAKLDESYCGKCRSIVLDELKSKYYSLGPDPIAAIKSIGFTREEGRFGVIAYVHESLPLDMRHLGSQDGWVCVCNGWELVHEAKSLESLKDYVLGIALAALKSRGAK